MDVKRKPKILILADRPGWAYDISARALQQSLKDELSIEIAYVTLKPDLHKYNFDILHVCWWGESYHLPFVSDPKKIVKEVSSHRWQEEGKFGPLSPREFCQKYLTDADTIVCTSTRLQRLVQPFRQCHLTPNGFSLEPKPVQYREGPITFGWAGNLHDTCKGYHDILEPAARNFIEILVAPGDVPHQDMEAFYGRIDVLCVASTYEGEPLTLLEAMAVGNFPIATDVGIVPELIQHQKNGLIVERTPEAFKEAFSWCMNNVDSVRAAALANARMVRRQRNWERLKGAWRRAWMDAVHKLETSEAQVAPCDQTASEPNDLMSHFKNHYSNHFGKHKLQNLSDAYPSAHFYYNAELAFLPSSLCNHMALDIGSGQGLLLRYLKERGFTSLTGIDIDEALARTAEDYLKQYDIPIVNSDVFEYLKGKENTYGLITAFDIIEHFSLEQGFRLASAIYRALCPGGLAVFRTLNMANLFGGYSLYMDITHQMGYTERNLVELLQQAGFKDAQLFLPEWPEGHQKTEKFKESWRIHKHLFSLIDRTEAKCFDKNIIVIGFK